jgi:hypothetical protein
MPIDSAANQLIWHADAGIIANCGYKGKQLPNEVLLLDIVLAFN